MPRVRTRLRGNRRCTMRNDFEGEVVSQGDIHGVYRFIALCIENLNDTSGTQVATTQGTPAIPSQGADLNAKVSSAIEALVVQSWLSVLTGVCTRRSLCDTKEGETQLL